MKKFLRVTEIVLKVIIVVVLIVLTAYLVLCSYDVAIDNSFTLSKGSYGKNPTWLSDGDETIVDDIYEKNSGNDYVATYEIYELICKKLMLSKAYGSRAKSVIQAWVGESYDDKNSLSVDVTNNSSHQYLVEGEPELNANQKVLKSYTNSVYLTDCSNDGLKGVLKSAVQFADRGYSDGVTSYKQKGSLKVMDDGDEIFDWSGNVTGNEATASRVYKDTDLRDIDNFITNKDTIIPDSCKVRREYDEKYSMYKYTINYNLDCSSSGEGCATYYEVSAVKDFLGGFMKDMSYDSLEVELQLYSNGYLLRRSLVQNWTVTVNFLNFTGHARSSLDELYTYKANECKITELKQ